MDLPALSCTFYVHKPHQKRNHWISLNLIQSHALALFMDLPAFSCTINLHEPHKTFLKNSLNLIQSQVK